MYLREKPVDVKMAALSLLADLFRKNKENRKKIGPGLPLEPRYV